LITAKDAAVRHCPLCPGLIPHGAFAFGIHLPHTSLADVDSLYPGMTNSPSFDGFHDDTLQYLVLKE